MSIVGAAVVATLVIATLSASRDPSGARDCLLPTSTLASARDTAAFCAEAFVERNGYTELPGTSNREMIAIEPRDRGRTLTDLVESRRRTIARGPVLVCEGANGLSVVFHVYDPMDSRTGRVVTMSRRYDGMQLLTGFTHIDAPEPGCARP